MKHQLTIQIELFGNPSKGHYPSASISINNVEYFNGCVENSKLLDFNIVTDSNTGQIDICHFGKTNHDTVVDDQGRIVEDLSLELKSISINGIKVKDTILYSSCFYVDFPDNILQEYHQQGISPPAYLINNLYFGFNGRYEFKFLTDQRKEVFRQLWEDEEQSHVNQQMIVNGQEVFSRYGEIVETQQEFNLTIFDLEKIISESK